MAGLNHQNGAEVAPRRINRVPSNRLGVRGLLSRSASVMKKPFVVEVRAGVEVGASPRSVLRFFDICEICESQFGICEMVGRPETHPVKKIIGFTEEMIEAVENWRAKQRPVTNLSEAIRRLVELDQRSKK